MLSASEGQTYLRKILFGADEEIGWNYEHETQKRVLNNNFVYWGYSSYSH